MATSDKIKQFMNYREFNYNTFISLKHKYVYIEVAKAACTTIKKRLQGYETEPLEYPHKEVHTDIFCSPFVKPYQIQKRMLEKILFDSQYYKFTFVRNPYSRILSAYLEKILNKKPQAKQILKILDGQYNESKSDYKDITFSDFLYALKEMSPKDMDKHWRPQYLLLMEPLIQYDFVGKVEKFENDWDVVVSKIKLKPDTRNNVLWHKTNSGELINKYYTPELKKIIKEIYELDFQKYDYPLDI